MRRLNIMKSKEESKKSKELIEKFNSEPDNTGSMKLALQTVLRLVGEEIDRLDQLIKSLKKE
jgi:hypothetical protein